MSEERDAQTAGAPVEENEPSGTEVRAAVERATESGPAGTVDTRAAEASEASEAPEVRPSEPTVSDDTIERPVIAPVVDQPSAGPGPSASEIFAAQPQYGGSSRQTHESQAASAASGASGAPTTQGSDLAQRLEADSVAPVVAAGGGAASGAAAGAASAPTAADLGPARDGEIRISSDHPMAALYMQTPMPPEIKGNRGAGILIALLASVGFALVFAGVIALIAAPSYPPSTFLAEGLLPALLTWSYLGSVLAFFVGLAFLVLISGRAGWWAYVIGGFFVGLIVFVAAFFGMVIDTGEEFRSSVSDLLAARLRMSALIVAIIAAVIAREVTVWFGAWIGSRGRKVARKNAAAVAEYEIALAEVQAKKL
ncbi:hypothetical protein ACR5KS_09990 [Leucobacter sp. W1153]|uniref:hypothetical protein n=1 Tax=Leucobacter sp. W1153 TaxID=3439064 RepID=UPI003F3DFDD8